MGPEESLDDFVEHYLVEVEVFEEHWGILTPQKYSGTTAAEKEEAQEK